MAESPPFATNLFGQRRDDVSEDRLRALEARLAAAETGLTERAYGIVSESVAALTSTAAEALSKTATEAVHLTSPAAATLAGRRYKITALIGTNDGGSWNFAVVKIRRGTTVAGTLLGLAYYPHPPAAGWDVLRAEAFDTPGAQAAQQWVLTHELDTSVCDLYGPSGIWVEDVGPA